MASAASRSLCSWAASKRLGQAEVLEQAGAVPGVLAGDRVHGGEYVQGAKAQVGRGCRSASRRHRAPARDTAGRRPQPRPPGRASNDPRAPMTSDARPVGPQTTKARGDEAERRALAHLAAKGLVPVERNYRVARGPRARGGEIDLILRDRDGTLVFVEVRARARCAPWRRGGDGRLPQAAAAGLRRPALPRPVRVAAALPLRCRHGRRRADRVAARGLRCLVKRS